MNGKIKNTLFWGARKPILLGVLLDEVETESGKSVAIVDFSTGNHLLELEKRKERDRSEKLLIRVGLVCGLLRHVDRADLNAGQVRTERGVVTHVAEIVRRGHDRPGFFLSFTDCRIGRRFARLRKAARKFPRLTAKQRNIHVRITRLPRLHVLGLRPPLLEQAHLAVLIDRKEHATAALAAKDLVVKNLVGITPHHVQNTRIDAGIFVRDDLCTRTRSPSGLLPRFGHPRNIYQRKLPCHDHLKTHLTWICFAHTYSKPFRKDMRGNLIHKTKKGQETF